MGSRRDCTWILGLSGFRVVTMDEAEDSRLTIRIERRGVRRYTCSGCGRRTGRVRSSRERTWDDLPWASHHVTLIYPQRRLVCRACGIRTERIEFADAKARVTRRLRQQIGVDCQSMPTSHAAVRHGVSWGKARRAEEAFLAEWDRTRVSRISMRWARCCRRPRSSSTNSTCCSTPAPRSTTCAAKNSFGRARSCASTVAGNAGCCCDAGRPSAGRSAENSKPCSPRIAACSKRTCCGSNSIGCVTYKTRPGVLNFLNGWINALRWQRLPEMDRLGEFLFRHIEGIAAYCDHLVRFGVVESINTTIKAVLRRARGMRDEQMLLLKLKWTTAHPIRSARDLAAFLTAQPLYSNR